MPVASSFRGRSRAQASEARSAERPVLLSTGSAAGFIGSMDHDNDRAGLWLVHAVVNKHFKHLDGVVPSDDLVSHGSVGMVKAARDYKPEKGLSFRTYAWYRIRGAILDGLRENDLLSRRDRRMVAAAERTWSRLAQELGREPTHREVADRLGVDREGLDRAYKFASPFSVEHEY